MSDWEQSLIDKVNSLAGAEFDYIETSDIREASKLDLGCTGIYMQARVIYFEIKNLSYLLKENGRRKTAQIYTMYKEVLTAIAKQDGAFVNCFAPNAFLVIYPGTDQDYKKPVTGAMKISYAISETFKQQFTNLSALEFSMGLDHGHIMGTKCQSDNGGEHISWFGTSILKAMRISKECARPFYVGISGNIYHSLGQDLRTTTRRILGIKKSVELWTKVSYQYENVKKHLYQTNHKIPLDAE